MTCKNRIAATLCTLEILFRVYDFQYPHKGDNK